MTQSDKNLKAHVAMGIACAIWGLMSPLGKDAMQHGLSGLMLVTFRVVGAAACFWVASMFTRNEEVRSKDLLMLFFASMLGIVFNQCCFTIGLSLTSPINASIVTTSMPIFTMVLAALFLREPVTSKKVIGIFCGAIGALLLIIESAKATKMVEGNMLGDILCLMAQLSFATYLTIFKKLISRYSVVTCMKWMFTYASMVIIPFTFSDFASLSWSSVSAKTWMETSFVVFGATFVAYLLMMYGQKNLRPTIVSMYNYVQPVVASVVGVLTGLGVFGFGQATSIILIFLGVWLVTQSRSAAATPADKL